MENTWTHAFLPPSKDTRPCKANLKRKLDEQGRTARWNAILVTKGYAQKYSVNYEETFSSVIPFDVLLHIAGKFKSAIWRVQHAKFSTAFPDWYDDSELFVWLDSKGYKLQQAL